MGKPENGLVKSSKRILMRKILILIAALLLIVTLILFMIPPVIPDFVFLTLLFLTFVDIVIIIWLSTQYYNMGITFIGMIVLAIFFRRMRWPVTGFLFTFGFTGLSCLSFYFSVIFLKKYNHNPFLKYIGFSSSMILSIAAVGLLWKNMHWPLAGLVLNTGLGLYIPFLFAFVFTLPGSNYINWDKSERIVFFRAIIIPMAFVYILVVLMFVFPDIYTSMTRTPLLPFDMVKLDLLNKPGLY
jgi:hypothetical protein